MNYYVLPPQGELAGRNSKLADEGNASFNLNYPALFSAIKSNRVVILSLRNTAELNLFKFFDSSATYSHRNAFILTYSAKATQTYTASTIPMVSGKFTENIIVSNGSKRVRPAGLYTGRFTTNNQPITGQTGYLYLNFR